MKIKWTEDLKIGISFIDTEHKELVDMFDSILSSSLTEDDELKNLLKYTKYYFADEESLLLDIGFPSYSLHKNEHMFFIANLEKIVTERKNNGEEKAKLTVLLDYYIKHIVEEDCKIKEHFLNSD